MKKFNELMKAIESNHAEIALNLAGELYNDVRDFSQCINFGIDEASGQLTINLEGATPEYAREKKDDDQRSGDLE